MPTAMFREIQPEKLIATVVRLRQRIRDRFPEANLVKVASELEDVTRETAARSAAIRRPDLRLRAASAVLLLAAALVFIAGAIAVRPRLGETWSLSELIQTIGSACEALFFLGGGVFFLATLEVRAKRRRCLQALHELRSMAHIVDLHQLTKDPDRVREPGPDTLHSPARSLTRFELARYLDYCSELLSVMGKVAALYVQGFPDAVALQAVDDVEDLTTSLSRKIWQKIMILEPQVRAADAAVPAAPTTAPPA
jgi:hypothetical protein